MHHAAAHPDPAIMEVLGGLLIFSSALSNNKYLYICSTNINIYASEYNLNVNIKNAPSPVFPTTTTLVQQFSSLVQFELQFTISKHSTELGPNHTQTEPWFGSQFEPVQIWTMTSLEWTVIL